MLRLDTLGRPGEAYLRRLGLFLTTATTFNRETLCCCCWNDTSDEVIIDPRLNERDGDEVVDHPYGFICNAIPPVLLLLPYQRVV